MEKDILIELTNIDININSLEMLISEKKKYGEIENLKELEEDLNFFLNERNKLLSQEQQEFEEKGNSIQNQEKIIEKTNKEIEENNENKTQKISIESQEKKSDWKEKLKESRAQIVINILNKIESKELTWTKLWSEGMQAHNPFTKQSYNGSNKLRLALASIENGFKDPRWLTFKQATNKKYKVKKGSKATYLEKWVFTKEVKEIDENGKEIIKHIKLEKPYINIFAVFNAEQIENFPKLESTENVLPTNDEFNQIFNNLIASSKCEIIQKEQDSAFYWPKKDKIVIPTEKQFNELNSNIKFGKFSTLLHEMSHSTGHPSRLNRHQENTNYAQEELIAEFSSIFLQHELQLPLTESDKENDEAYIQSWYKQLRQNPHFLFEAITKAEKSANYLNTNYQNVLEQQQKQKLKKTMEENLKEIDLSTKKDININDLPIIENQKKSKLKISM